MFGWKLPLTATQILVINILIDSIALLPALHDALLQILEWQVPRIQESLGQRTTVISTEARALGLDVVDPARRLRRALLPVEDFPM
mgnify:CR=1 FL=1